MAALEVDGGDVLRLVLQFLREQGLTRSVKTLQDEANISTNLVDDVAAFTSDIMSGRWDALLPQLALLKIPPPLLMSIYEQIVKELMEQREVDVARALLRGSLPLLMLKQDDPARYSRLELMAARGFDASAYSEGGGKEARRAALARALSDHLVAAPPSRLIALLGDGLRWQAQTGQIPANSKFDIFRGVVPAAREELERPVSTPAGSIRGGAIPTAVAFTPDGSALVVASADGIIEVYDPDTLRIRKDLEYQAKDEFMLHDEVNTHLGLAMALAIFILNANLRHRFSSVRLVDVRAPFVM